MPRIIPGTLILLAFTMMLGACAPMLATRGNYLDDERLKTLQLDVSTRDEVEKKLGSPTSVDPFDANKWFYIGEKTSTKAFFDPKVKSRKIVTLTFNDQGILKNAQQTDGTNAKEIDVVEKVTPSPGREMNAFEQFLSNIGKFNQTPGGANSQGQSQGR